MLLVFAQKKLIFGGKRFLTKKNIRSWKVPWRSGKKFLTIKKKGRTIPKKVPEHRQAFYFGLFLRSLKHAWQLTVQTCCTLYNQESFLGSSGSFLGFSSIFCGTAMQWLLLGYKKEPTRDNGGGFKVHTGVL